MFKYVLLLAVLFSTACSAQESGKPPRFEDYPAEVYSGKRITPKEIEKKYDELRAEVKSKGGAYEDYDVYALGEREDTLNGKINFAGRYVVYTSWEAGAYVVGGVNVVTGKRLQGGSFYFFVDGVCANGVKARNFVKKQADSRLMIVGAVYGDPGKYKEQYYVLEDGQDKLKLVYTVTEGLPDPCKPLPKKNG